MNTNLCFLVHNLTQYSLALIWRFFMISFQFQNSAVEYFERVQMLETTCALQL